MRDGDSEPAGSSAYCLKVSGDLENNVLSYVKQAAAACLEDFLSRASPLTNEVFAEAIRAEMPQKVRTRRGNEYISITKPQSALVSRALFLFTANIVLRSSWRISGPGALATTDLRHGTVPINPVTKAQLDKIIIQKVLHPFQKETLMEIERLVYARDLDNWMELFLTLFVLLSNAESLFAEAQKDATRAVAAVSLPFEKIGFRVADSHQEQNSAPYQTNSLKHSCNILLCYFHFAYRKTPSFSAPHEAGVLKRSFDRVADLSPSPTRANSSFVESRVTE